MTKWAAHLARFLSPKGIVVATVHGRWSEFVHIDTPFTDDQNWQRIVDGFDRLGYGYADYTRGLSPDIIAGSYGVSLVKPHVTVRDIEEIPGVRIHLYRERGWGDNHDLIVLGRPAIDEAWAVMLPERVEQVRLGRGTVAMGLNRHILHSDAQRRISGDAPGRRPGEPAKRRDLGAARRGSLWRLARSARRAVDRVSLTAVSSDPRERSLVGARLHRVEERLEGQAAIPGGIISPGCRRTLATTT